MRRIHLGEEKLHLRFTIIGAGGNGSHFFRGLCQDLRTHLNAFESTMYNCPFALDHILLVDGDKIEKKNLGNQIFEESEIGEYKVVALSERYGDHYDLNVLRHTEYIQDTQDLHRLNPIMNNIGIQNVPVIIAMVDNNATRRIIHEYFMDDQVPSLLYMDAGIHGVEYDRNKSPRAETGNNGQIVIGLKWNGAVVLEPICSLYPEILEDTESRVPGCGVVVQSAPQRLSTNKFAAQLANNVVNSLLTEKSILIHQLLFDSRMCGTRPVFVSEDQEEQFHVLVN